MKDIKGIKDMVLDNKSRTKLIEEAGKYDPSEYSLFAAELGWEDWMDKCLKNDKLDNVDLTEEEMQKIDKVLTEIWNTAHPERGLKALRQAAGLTQAELAEASGVNIRMVQYYENGFKDINKAALETGIKLADALGCDPRDLLKK